MPRKYAWPDPTDPLGYRPLGWVRGESISDTLRTMDLEPLLRAVRDEEEDAFENLVVAGTGQLCAYMRSRGIDSEAAKDLTHDVLIIASQKLPSVVDRPSLTAWLFKTAFYVSSAYQSKLARQQKTSLARADEVAVDERSLSSEYRGAREQVLVRELVMQMPTRMREVALIDLYGGDLVEYARRANLTSAAVRGIRRRYKNWLRERLPPELRNF